MTDSKDTIYRLLWAEDLEGIDREIVRLAELCQVRLFEPDVIGRVVKNDAQVCGAPNAVAFRKLHDLVLLHLAIREKSVDSFGETSTAVLEDYVLERLRKTFPDLPGGWPQRAS